jgi:hypothetical protein
MALKRFLIVSLTFLLAFALHPNFQKLAWAQVPKLAVYTTAQAI